MSRLQTGAFLGVVSGATVVFLEGYRECHGAQNPLGIILNVAYLCTIIGCLIGLFVGSLTELIMNPLIRKSALKQLHESSLKRNTPMQDEGGDKRQERERKGKGDADH